MKTWTILFLVLATMTGCVSVGGEASKNADLRIGLENPTQKQIKEAIRSLWRDARSKGCLDANIRGLVAVTYPVDHDGNPTGLPTTAQVATVCVKTGGMTIPKT